MSGTIAGREGAAARHWLEAPEAGRRWRLAVVLGNTNCRLALMEGSELRGTLVLPTAGLRMEGASARLRALAGGVEVADAGLCSVVPSQEAELHALFADAGLRAPREVRAAVSSFFPSEYRTMRTLGADRYCGVLAAHVLHGAPAVVVDCGTATTLNVLDPGGVFLGGAIAPGIGTALRALHERTAQLPLAEASVETHTKAPGSLGVPPLIGADTVECLRAGAVHFTRLAMEGAAREIQKQYGDDTPIILTGGNAPVLRAAGLAVSTLRTDENLLFRGVLFHLLFTS